MADDDALSDDASDSGARARAGSVDGADGDAAGDASGVRPDKVTIYEVARRAGVSTATVSHTLNRPHKVSAKTRQKVMDVIDDLDYVPKAAAISQARSRVGRIGVVAPFTSYSSYATRLFGVMEELSDDAVEVVVFDHGSSAESPEPLMDALPATGRLDGLLVMGVPLDDALVERLLRRRMPTVLVDGTHDALSSVCCNDELGGYLVGKHLIERGHRRFAFVSEAQHSSDYVSAGQERMAGFTRALRSADIGVDALEWVITTSDVVGGRGAVQELLGMPDRPTAVFANHDELAAGLLAGLRDASVLVPEGVAVVGYDGTDLSEVLDLTTVSQPLRESGRVAAGLLRAAFDKPTSTVQHVSLSVELIVGMTT
jgi:DNA-binding LacI/PurR family transcriptional regulator